MANFILRAVRELLVVKPSSLGDVVHGLRVVGSMKEEWPDLRVSWVVRDVFSPLVEACGVVDEVFVFRRGAGPLAYLSLMRRIRRKRFDCVFEMQGLLRSALLAAAAKAPVKWGRSDGREGSTLFYAKVAAPKYGRETHAVDVLLAFKDAVGLEPSLSGELKFPGAKLSAETESALEKVTQGGERSLVTLFPESRRAEKEWAGFTELAERLKARGGFALAWAGSRGGGGPQLDGLANLSGKTSLEELPALVERSAVVVTNDSAPLHVASALGRPLVSLFGPTDPRRFGPYPLDSPNARTLRGAGGKLSDLSAEVVEKAVLELFDGV